MMEENVWALHRKSILAQMQDQSVLVVFSQQKSETKMDVDRNYYYLSGNFEYDNIVLLAKIDRQEQEVMFIHPYDEQKAKWVGAPLSKADINRQNGIKTIYYLNEFEDYLQGLLQKAPLLYLDLKEVNNPLSYEMDFAKKQKAAYPTLMIMDASCFFKKSRTIKHPFEIEEMKKAIDITKEGIHALLRQMKPMKEYQLESYFDQAIKYHGATGYAFPTIAASGKNACCLHYTENNCDAKDGDLILFDLGASYHLYCADISRTFPVNGRFTARQKQLYNIVLEGQNVVMKAASIGKTTKELNQILMDYYAVALKEIGLIQHPEEVKKYYFHGVSHHIGLDCHDWCLYTPLEEGSVISCEPGLYIEEEGIGIRIEDDLLITKDGCINLSADILKTVEELEDFMKGGN